MAFQLDIPFYGVELQFLKEGNVQVPLLEHNVARLDASVELLAAHFKKAFQKKVLDRGNYWPILDFPKADFKPGKVAVSFPKARNGFSHPAFDLTFDYYFAEQARGLWAVLPALGLESFAHDEEQLRLNLAESIRLEFARKQRLKNLKDVISTIWYKNTTLHENEITLQFHTLKELEQVEEDEKVELLPKVAQQITLTQTVNFGREKELEQLANMLKGKFNRNVLIVGPSGVGKTNLVWELAFRKTQLGIKQKLFETSASTMIKELTGDTGWQDNLSYLCAELTKKGSILFVRNFLELFEVGQYEGNSVSMAEYLRSYISRNELTLISECTDEEYAKIEVRSPNYLSMFQIIRLQEPKDDLEAIIIKKINQIADNRQVKIEAEAVKETIRLNKRYTPYSGFPGKPIRFLENLLLNTKPQTDETPATLLNKSWVYRQFCEEAGMPRFMVDPSVAMDLTAIKTHFQANIFGQAQAIETVIDLLASVKTALTREGKPIASLLFVGPTGVGKTEMAKVLAQFMFGNKERMIRFDMSEYANPYTVMRLTGESYGKDGLLTSAVRQNPFSVVLFDEIEKAHPVFYDLLLQMLGEGRLTDSAGRLVDFCSTIIIMTSNIGASKLQAGRVSYKNEVNIKAVTAHFDSEVRKHFRPELFNRIDQVITFEPLTAEVVRLVTDREINLLKKREGIAYRSMDFFIDEAVYNFLGEKGYDPKYGARQLQRAIREELVIPLAARLNAYPYDEHLVVNVRLSEARTIALDIETDPFKFDLLLEELTRNEFADHAGELRRSIKRLQEGNFFIQLTSELSMLESELKKQGKAFWKDKTQSEKYSFYLATRDKVEKMATIIEGYEEELALVCMGLQPYNTYLIEDIKTWEQQYFNLKIELFTRIHPQSNSCKLGVYGQEIDKVIRLYFDIFEARGFIPAASTLWFREAHYYEEEKISRQEGDKTIETREARQEYISKSFDIQEFTQSFTPPEAGDVLVGIEIDVFGECPYLYFSEEEGFHKWKASGNKFDIFHVISYPTINDSLTPLDIHRKRYFDKKKTRRVYTEEHLKDSVYKINREIVRDNLAELLTNAMNERFGDKLNEVLM